MTAGAEAELGVRSGVRVVLDPDGQPEPPLHLRREHDLGDREVDGTEDRAGPLVDPRGDAEADGDHVGRQELPHDGGHLVQHGLL